MSGRLRYTRDELLKFRDLACTRGLPADLDAQQLSELTEAAFFDSQVGTLPTGADGKPLRSRLIGDGGMDMNPKFASKLIDPEYSPVSPQRMGPGGRWGGAGRGSLDRTNGFWKKGDDAPWSRDDGSKSWGGKMSPGKPGSNASRWVKTEEENSWRRREGIGMPEPRYAWNDKAINSYDTNEPTPEWADVNPNEKIPITADAIEAERQKMQAKWRTEAQERKENAQHVEEIDEDEIERWRKEQEEEEKREARRTAQPAPAPSMPTVAPQAFSVVAGLQKGQQVNLAQLFGTVPPGRGTTKEEASVLTRQLAQATLGQVKLPPEMKPVGPSAASEQGDVAGQKLLNMLKSPPPGETTGVAMPGNGQVQYPRPIARIHGEVAPQGTMMPSVRPPPGHMMPPPYLTQVPPMNPGAAMTGYQPNEMERPHMGHMPPSGTAAPPRWQPSGPPPMHMPPPGQPVNLAALFGGGQQQMQMPPRPQQQQMLPPNPQQQMQQLQQQQQQQLQQQQQQQLQQQQQQQLRQQQQQQLQQQALQQQQQLLQQQRPVSLAQIVTGSGQASHPPQAQNPTEYQMLLQRHGMRQ